MQEPLPPAGGQQSVHHGAGWGGRRAHWRSLRRGRPCCCEPPAPTGLSSSCCSLKLTLRLRLACALSHGQQCHGCVSEGGPRAGQVGVVPLGACGLRAEGRGTPSAGDTPSWGSEAAPVVGAHEETRVVGHGRQGRCMSVQPAWPGSAPIVAAVADLCGLVITGRHVTKGVGTSGRSHPQRCGGWRGLRDVRHPPTGELGRN